MPGINTVARGAENNYSTDGNVYFKNHSIVVFESLVAHPGSNMASIQALIIMVQQDRDLSTIPEWLRTIPEWFEDHSRVIRGPSPSDSRTIPEWFEDHPRVIRGPFRIIRGPFPRDLGPSSSDSRTIPEWFEDLPRVIQEPFPSDSGTILE